MVTNERLDKMEEGVRLHNDLTRRAQLELIAEVRRLRNCEIAVQRLVALKDHKDANGKDANGKDDYYQGKVSFAWQFAREVTRGSETR